MKKDDQVYLGHILQAIQRIQEYTKEGREAFLSDTRTQDAVIRNFEIIGEAVKRLSPTTLNRSPHISWRVVAGFRDVLIHGYMGVDLVEVWNVVAQSLPELKTTVEALLADRAS